jgi:NifU-like protein involved in Fe-S cluster formation
MSDPLYAKDLLRWAANAVGAGRLDPFDVEGHAYNPTCGDKISVTLRLDEQGRVTAMAHQTSACVLAQASASILGAQLSGADRQKVQDLRASVGTMLQDGRAPPAPFADYVALNGAAPFRNRHTCVLLPIDAVLSALETIPREKNAL